MKGLSLIGNRLRGFEGNGGIQGVWIASVLCMLLKNVLISVESKLLYGLLRIESLWLRIIISRYFTWSLELIQ